MAATPGDRLRRTRGSPAESGDYVSARMPPVQDSLLYSAFATSVALAHRASRRGAGTRVPPHLLECLCVVGCVTIGFSYGLRVVFAKNAFLTPQNGANSRKYALETPRERIAKICAPRKSYYPRMTPTCPTPTTDATYVPGAGEREGEKRRTDSAFGHKAASQLHTSGDTKYIR